MRTWGVSQRPLTRCRYQKWFVHRRLRPEEYAGRVDRHKRGFATYPLHPDVVFAGALDRVWAAHGSYLLPQAFPEGSPLHPAYGSGHATVGECQGGVGCDWHHSVSRCSGRMRDHAQSIFQRVVRVAQPGGAHG